MNQNTVILKKAKKVIVDPEITAVVISSEVRTIVIEDQKSLKIYKLMRTEKGLQMQGG
jgi:hypothetical protein